MPIELKVILAAGLCFLVYEGINLYIKWRVIKIINDNEKSNHLLCELNIMRRAWKPYAELELTARGLKRIITPK